jgi:hypothetical protein
LEMLNVIVDLYQETILAINTHLQLIKIISVMYKKLFQVKNLVLNQIDKAINFVV